MGHHRTQSLINSQINYDFQSDSNAEKWNNLFVNSLKNILFSLHPDLDAADEAFCYTEELLYKLLRLLISNSPRNVQELQEDVLKLFPPPIEKWATAKAQNVLQECYEVQCNSNSTPSTSSSSTVSGGKKKKLLLVNIPNNNNNNINNNRDPIINCPLKIKNSIEKMHDLLTKEVFQYRIDMTLTIYLCSLIEYIAADILKLAGDYVKNIRHDFVNAQDVKIAINADKVLIDLLNGVEDGKENKEISNLSGIFWEESIEDGTDDEGISYDMVAKELIHEEKQFLRNLNLIIKVFREPFIRLSQNSPSSLPNTPTSPTNCLEEKPLISEKDIDDIFSNILDINEFSVNFLGLVEDAMEMNGGENSEAIGIGMCFEEMAENVEFEVFEKYTMDMFRSEENSSLIIPKSRINDLLSQQPIINVLDTAGHKFILSAKFILPKLLLCPVIHCLHYFDYIKLLMSLATTEADKESFKQTEGCLTSMQKQINEATRSRNLKIYEGYLRLNRSHQRSKNKRNALKKKISDLKKCIDGFDFANFDYDCNEFIIDGYLQKARKNDRKTIGRHDRFSCSERFCFLFDYVLLSCKTIAKENQDSSQRYRVKEKFFINNKIEILESDIDPCAFEVVSSNKSTNFDLNRGSIIFLAASPEEKDIWISNLLILSSKPILDRTLDVILAEEDKKNPLRLPSPKDYIFTEKDDDSNIIFETGGSNNLSIKGATLHKLIERLTYHQPPHLIPLKTFLTTYRFFCSPQQLLNLLIERFDIPLDVMDRENWSRNEVKKFKKEYLEPVQFRVINVIKQWIDAHFYDFEKDDQLLGSLRAFLAEKVSKVIKVQKWVQTLSNMIIRKQQKSSSKNSENKILSEIPPPIEYWLAPSSTNEYELSLMTIHPLELARQLTLYEFDLYCAVQSSELIGLKWIKEGKEINSPNLLKIMRHSNNLTYWLEKEIVETVNFDERVALMSRIMEIMQVLSDLNNFSGIIEIMSALESASIHRLEHTFNALHPKHRKLIEEMKDLMCCEHYKKYCIRLRAINPPCVPFFGLYQTQMIHFEEGNSDYIDESKGLINFSKRRKIAEITAEIQGYQNQPYCLLVCPEIREFLENLNPIEEDKSEKEFNDYLYEQSLLIEPRAAKQPLKTSVRRWPHLPTLKSPGIKPSSSVSHTAPHPTSLPTATSMSNHPQSTSSSNPTSPTLISPKTPPSTTSDTSVFANVIIGNQPATPAPTPPPIIPISTITPPPIPPRTRNFHQRTNSESSVTSATVSPTATTPLTSFAFNFVSPSVPPPPPPPPPPRVPRPSTILQQLPSSHQPPLPQPHLSSNSLSSPSDHQTPPPLPPRGITSSLSSSSSFGRTTLPRRNSTETHPHDNVSNPFHRRNSSSSSSTHSHVQPQLPPKTYRAKR